MPAIFVQQRIVMGGAHNKRPPERRAAFAAPALAAAACRNMMQAEDILEKLTLEQKIALGSGANAWQTKDLSNQGVPAAFLSDGPHGLRTQNVEEGELLGLNDSYPSTCFPGECLTACSWDPDLLGEIGATIAKEAIAYKVGLVLGPGLCMKRNPLCGRNFEYFSEDPYLAGKLGAGYVRGMQANKIGACLKHFAANNQELVRFLSRSRMDERTLREIYLTAFEIAVKESNPETIMCAYDWVDEKPCASNKRLLTDILRDEWGYEGLVMTDWGALHDRTQSFRAGLDLAMPGGIPYGEDAALQAVEDGSLSMHDVDRSALRVLKLMLSKAWLQNETAELDAEADDAVAEKVVENSLVLLKNDDSMLPIADGAKVALIGEMAEKPRYQGGGSSHINPTKLSVLKDSLEHASYSRGYNEDGATTKELIDEAVAAAKAADVAVVCAGLPASYESEGFDRDTMAMPDGHNELIEAVAAANPNTVVVLMCGAPVETPWEPRVKSILYAGLCGQAGARAIAKVLRGEVNPSGRLAESWPVHYADCPSSSFYGGDFRDAQYREGIFMGYRYYDSANVPVRFAFGHGLSYTTFELSDLQVSADKVSVTVKNTGNRAGADVVQMFIHPPTAALVRPVRELKGFAKVWLEPGETKTVEMPLSDRSFAVWSDGWKVQKGDYTVQVGDLTATISRDGEDVPAPAWQKNSWYETLSGEPSYETFKTMCGYEFLEREVVPGHFTMENTLAELAPHSEIIHSVVEALEAGLNKFAPVGTPEHKMMIAMATEIPLGSVAILNMFLSADFLKALLDVANGNDVPGFEQMLKEATSS